MEEHGAHECQAITLNHQTIVHLDCGNSGTTMRLLMGLCLAAESEFVLSGDDSLSRRPMDRVLLHYMDAGVKFGGTGSQLCPPIVSKGMAVFPIFKHIAVLHLHKSNLLSCFQDYLETVLRSEGVVNLETIVKTCSLRWVLLLKDWTVMEST